MQRKIRVGAVNYLNTKPLIYELERLAPQAELVLDYPSRLADDLAGGRLDVALIPSIEFFQDPALHDRLRRLHRLPRAGAQREAVRPQAARARFAPWRSTPARGPAWPWSESCSHERHGLTPQLEPLPIGASLADTQADAVLLIGDRAMHSLRRDILPSFGTWETSGAAGRSCRSCSPCGPPGRPPIWAAWTRHWPRPATPGLAHLDEIARREAPALGLTAPAVPGVSAGQPVFLSGAARAARAGTVLSPCGSAWDLHPRELNLGFGNCPTAG